jgi:hypothetical protein
MKHYKTDCHDRLCVGDGSEVSSCLRKHLFM